jgi:hypothetical protein
MGMDCNYRRENEINPFFFEFTVKTSSGEGRLHVRAHRVFV